jgi:hypothetical protein
MSVYVDALFDWPAELVKNAQARRLTEKNGQWSHCMADTEEELLAFGAKIGLRSDWLQRGATADAHFDLTPGKRKLAVARGAIELTRAEFMAFRKHKRSGSVLLWVRTSEDPQEVIQREYMCKPADPEPPKPPEEPRKMPSYPDGFRRSQWA